MKNATSPSQSITRRPQPQAGAMCCFGAGSTTWMPNPWAISMAAMYDLAYRQAVESERSDRFFRRFAPSVN